VHRFEDYKALFDPSAPVRGESSPTYSLFPQYRDVPRRIAQLVPDARFVYLVRDPVERIVSHYMHNVAVDGVRQSFDDHVGDLSRRDNPYIFPCFYATQFERYLEVFPKEHVLVVDQADLLTRRDECMRGIFRFLGVDPTRAPHTFEKKHGSAAQRRRYPRGYEQLLDRVSASTMPRVPRRVGRGARRLLDRALWPPVESPVVSQAIRDRVKQVCGPEVQRLRALTGKSFESWSL